MKHLSPVAGAVAAVLVACTGQPLAAQSSWPPDNSANGGYPAYPQPGYGQPQPQGYGYPAPSSGYGQAGGGYGEPQGYPGPAQGQQPLSPGQLEQMVAPIALYRTACWPRFLPRQLTRHRFLRPTSGYAARAAPHRSRLQPAPACRQPGIRASRL